MQAAKGGVRYLQVSKTLSIPEKKKGEEAGEKNPTKNNTPMRKERVAGGPKNCTIEKKDDQRWRAEPMITINKKNRQILNPFSQWKKKRGEAQTVNECEQDDGI